MLPAAARAQQCVGDANGDNEVTIDEMITAVINGLEGCGVSQGLVPLTGTIAQTGGDTFRIWAAGDSGGIYHTECAPDGRFTLLVPPGDSYIVGFSHYHGPSEMAFSGFMVFPCLGGEEDHFVMGPDERGIDLGMVAVQDDGSFARPQRNPLDQLDDNQNGIPDSGDPEFHCQDIGDHGGFYGDDTDHDGFHDGDMDHDGHMNGQHHRMM
jgi:hypothetical protein